MGFVVRPVSRELLITPSIDLQVANALNAPRLSEIIAVTRVLFAREFALYGTPPILALSN